MDTDAADEGEDSRSVLAGWLDDYGAGRCDLADMQESFLSVCRSNPDAPWDALALLDQYQRRGRIDGTLARSLKTDIAQLVFGVPNQAEPAHCRPAPDAASYWRKPGVEGDRPAGASHHAFADPTLLSREPGSVTRPRGPEREDRKAHPASPASDVLRERYELVSVLGRGSTGTVYRAVDRHCSHLAAEARHVALKVLNLHDRDRPARLAALEREFHRAQLLSHPNILSVFDLDRDGDTFFIVMELLEGERLSDVLRRLDGRPMFREHALGIISSIGAALAHAHRRGIVHGGLVPGKVMITPSGDVRVLGFGCGRDRPLESHDGFASADASAQRLGNGEPHASDDVRSLACIAYELLAGRQPFGSRSNSAGRLPPRIAGLSAKQWRALRHALRWTRGERELDVVELLAGLGCAQVPNQPVPPQGLVPDVSRSRRWSMAAAAAALAVAVALGGMWYLDSKLPAVMDASAPRPRQEEPIAAPIVTVASGERSGVVGATAAERPAPTLAAVQAAPRIEEPAAESIQRGKAADASVPSEVGPSEVGFDKDTYVATESDGVVRLTVQRRGAARTAASFRWRLLGNSAEAGADYAGIGPDVERIGAGSGEASIIIPIVSDAVAESTEVFLVEIEPAEPRVVLGERSHAAVIIVDDD
jgi:protein kinase-like protein/Calx-beta domain-containing protein